MKIAQYLMISGVVLMTSIYPSSSSAQFFSSNLQKQIEDRSKRATQVANDIPEDNFGHSGWERYISLQGDRRITFGGLRITTGLSDTCVEFAAYEIGSGRPFPASIWQLWMGKNFDLVKGKSHGRFILKDRPGAYKLRAWGSRNDDIVFYLRGDPMRQGDYC